jgi:membrane fusion protein (multidrug efflux system)
MGTHAVTTTGQHRNGTLPPHRKSRRRLVAWLLASSGAAAIVVTGAVMVGTASIAGSIDAIAIETTATPPAFQLLPSEVANVAAMDLARNIGVSGTLVPVRQVNLSAQVSGLVQSVSAQPGEFVSGGTQLVAIDVADFRLQLEQQRATLAASRAQHEAASGNLARQRLLAERGLATTSTLENLQSEVATLAANIAALQAQMALAETQLGRASLAAPFDGTIAARMVEPGQIIAPGATLMTLVDQSTMVAEVAVPLGDSVSIRPGQVVELGVRGLDLKFPATVERINPMADDGTRSVKVFLSVPNGDGLLRGGMFVSGSIAVETATDTIAIPATAVLGQGEQAYVLALRDGLVEQRAVTVSRPWPDAGLVEIAAGLTAGDTVIAARLPQLVDGAAVDLQGE